MHSYPFHIGDYIKDTAHLTNGQDLAFRRLLDLYYDTESPIRNETQWVATRLRVVLEDVEFVLKEYFQLTESGWINLRADEEIAAYHERAEKNRRNGKKGGRPKKQGLTKGKNPVGSQSHPTGNPNERQPEPETINQKPVDIYTPPAKQTAKSKLSASDLVTRFGISEQLAADYMTVRKDKKSPLTETALKNLCEQFSLAGLTVAEGLLKCTQNGWVGFKPQWLENQKSSGVSIHDKRSSVIASLTGGAFNQPSERLG